MILIMVLILQTDEVHAKDNTRPGANTAGNPNFQEMEYRLLGGDQ